MDIDVDCLVLPLEILKIFVHFFDKVWFSSYLQNSIVQCPSAFREKKKWKVSNIPRFQLTSNDEAFIIYWVN